jgi:hypothetical protein
MNLYLMRDAKNQVEKYSKQIERKFTERLRKEYKGRKVKCSCFDSWSEGETYEFDGSKVLDIRALKDMEGNFYIDIDLNYQSANENKKSKHTFHLDTITVILE